MERVILRSDSSPGDASLKQSLEDQRQRNVLCDVQLRALDGHLFPAHKTVLAARSDVFSQIFQSSFGEAKNAIVDIQEESHILEEVLRFIYTSAVHVDESNALELLRAADFYSLPTLFGIMESHIVSSKVDNENCAYLAVASRKLNAKKLSVTAVEFMVENFDHVTNVEELEEEDMLLLVQDRRVCQEKNLPNTIKWLSVRKHTAPVASFLQNLDFSKLGEAGLREIDLAFADFDVLAKLILKKLIEVRIQDMSRPVLVKYVEKKQIPAAVQPVVQPVFEHNFSNEVCYMTLIARVVQENIPINVAGFHFFGKNNCMFSAEYQSGTASDDDSNDDDREINDDDRMLLTQIRGERRPCIVRFADNQNICVGFHDFVGLGDCFSLPFLDNFDKIRYIEVYEIERDDIGLLAGTNFERSVARITLTTKTRGKVFLKNKSKELLVTWDTTTDRLKIVRIQNTNTFMDCLIIVFSSGEAHDLFYDCEFSPSCQQVVCSLPFVDNVRISLHVIELERLAEPSKWIY